MQKLNYVGHVKMESSNEVLIGTTICVEFEYYVIGIQVSTIFFLFDGNLISQIHIAPQISSDYCCKKMH